MNEMYEPESGFLTNPDIEFDIPTEMRDVETLRFSKINVIAKGCRFGRIWLLKGLRKELQNSSAHRRQLQKEFEIHSRLHNPAVVQAVGFEEIPGMGPCIVEEWIEGKTLADLIREGEISKNERKRILHEIIEAAGYLHSMGVIHRDLKPSNVMIRNAGKKVVLIDFGLADTDDYVELKQPGGTPGFISPEQFTETTAAISDDIYSIGAIMKDLTPEYGAIARRCTGPIRKRPKDTEELLKIIARREKAPKLILFSALTASLMIIAILAGFHILSLSDSAKEAQRSISQARAIAAEAQTKVERLNDSLNSVTLRMNEAKDELSRNAAYDRAKEKAYNEGITAIDNTLARYDREVFSKFKEFSSAFTDSMQALNNKLQKITDNSCDPERFPEITPTDREKIRAGIYTHYLNRLTLYQSEWHKSVFPAAGNKGGSASL